MNSSTFNTPIVNGGAFSDPIVNNPAIGGGTFTDPTISGGIVKGDTSYLFVPGAAGDWALEPDGDPGRGVNLTRQPGGQAQFTSVGNHYIGTSWNIPIPIPGVLYGQPTRVTSVEVYYNVTGTQNSISALFLWRSGLAGPQLLAYDTPPHSGPDVPAITLTPSSSYNTLSSENGILNLQFQINFAEGATQAISVYGVRATMEHNY